MCLVNTNISKEVGRLHDWCGPMFGRRYASIPVSDEPPAQIARLRYVLELILDDWGLAPIGATERRDLLEILEDRYGNRSAALRSPVTFNRNDRSVSSKWARLKNPSC